jgi:DNA modification methylase
MPFAEQTRHRVMMAGAEGMDQLPDACIHLVVTSPPYPMIAMWDSLFAGRSPAVADALAGNDGTAAFECMHALLDAVWDELCRVMAPGAVACINIGDAVRTVDGRFALYPNHTRIQQALTARGLTALPGIIWRKQTNAPNKFMGSGVLPAGAYVTLEHEHILVFRKGGKRVFASEADKQRRRESALFWEERNAWFSDVWGDVKGARQSLGAPEARQRSAAFPVEIAQRLIAMYSVKGDRVLDPFLGTATTMVAAMAAGRHSIGYEIDAALAEAIGQSVAGAAAVSRAAHRQRLESHAAFVAARFREGRLPAHRNAHYGFPVMMAQETALLFTDALQVARIGEGDWRVDYDAVPQAGFCRDWDAWLAALPGAPGASAAPGAENPPARQRRLFQ